MIFLPIKYKKITYTKPPPPPGPRQTRAHGRREEQTRYIGKYYPPPLCFATQNIGEVSRRDGGVK